MTGAFPAEYPGAWQDIPLDVRRFLTAKTLDRQLILQDGPAGLIEWLYRGQPIAGGIVRYQAPAKEIWPHVVADTEAWLKKRAAQAASPQVPA